jgi:hypothetical protein
MEAAEKAGIPARLALKSTIRRAKSCGSAADPAPAAPDEFGKNV